MQAQSQRPLHNSGIWLWAAVGEIQHANTDRSHATCASPEPRSATMIQAFITYTKHDALLPEGCWKVLQHHELHVLHNHDHDMLHNPTGA